MKFPAVTVCNQNRVNCEALLTVVEDCKTITEGILECDKEIGVNTPARRTICSRCYNNSLAIVDFLYLEGCHHHSKQKEKNNEGENRGGQGKGETRGSSLGSEEEDNECNCRSSGSTGSGSSNSKGDKVAERSSNNGYKDDDTNSNKGDGKNKGFNLNRILC